MAELTKKQKSAKRDVYFIAVIIIGLFGYATAQLGYAISKGGVKTDIEVVARLLLCLTFIAAGVNLLLLKKLGRFIYSLLVVGIFIATLVPNGLDVKPVVIGMLLFFLIFLSRTSVTEILKPNKLAENTAITAASVSTNTTTTDTSAKL
ncbi:MAG: hypothetical protein JW841_01460 [Deltaproteobacteria bacterium]|nr:hypothetical protein [Deltaproteobacteria bacterium]